MLFKLECLLPAPLLHKPTKVEFLSSIFPQIFVKYL